MFEVFHKDWHTSIGSLIDAFDEEHAAQLWAEEEDREEGSIVKRRDITVKVRPVSDDDAEQAPWTFIEVTAQYEVTYSADEVSDPGEEVGRG